VGIPFLEQKTAGLTDGGSQNGPTAHVLKHSIPSNRVKLYNEKSETASWKGR